MQTITYRRNLITITEIFGTLSSKAQLPKTDILICSQLPSLPDLNQSSNFLNSSRNFSFQKIFKTMIIDLKKDINQLFNELHKNNKLKINKATKKDELQYIQVPYPTDKQIQELSLFFNKFAKYKKIKRSNTDKLKALRDKNALVISLVADKQNRPLCYHTYIADGTRATLLYSSSHRLSKCSAERSLIGRANRYLHWKDIIYFKKAGYTIYDFCGFDTDTKDKQLININLFKKSFGGQELVEYKSYHARSFAGKLVLLIFFWKWRNLLVRVNNLPILSLLNQKITKKC